MRGTDQMSPLKHFVYFKDGEFNLLLMTNIMEDKVYFVF